MSAAEQSHAIVPFPTAPPTPDEWAWADPVDDADDDAELAALEATPPPELTNPVEASRHLAVVARCRREQERLEAVYRDVRASLEAWRERETRRLTARAEWHEHSLGAYLARSGQRSLKLFGGTLRTVKGRERVEITDEAAFLAAATPDLVRTITEPDKRAILAHLKRTGEILPGTDVIVGDDTFAISIERIASTPETQRPW